MAKATCTSFMPAIAWKNQGPTTSGAAPACFRVRFVIRATTSRLGASWSATCKPILSLKQDAWEDEEGNELSAAEVEQRREQHDTRVPRDDDEF
jgi:hypothetical protein